jgi:hypothetical protein
MVFVLLNLLPNVYWVYPIKKMSEIDYNIEVQKIREYYGIKTFIELDQTLEFWNKSNSYINEIKKEIEKNEFTRLLSIYKKLSDVIKNAYLGNNPCLLSNYNIDKVDVGLGVWIYFFHLMGSMSFDSVIKLLSLKVIGEIILSEELKKFFAFLNISNTK